jgi:hypothetical protein
LILERRCDTNPERRPNFNFHFAFSEIVYVFREEAFLEALEVGIGAFKVCPVTVAPTKLQAKTPMQLAEKRKVLPAASSVTSCLWWRWTTPQELCGSASATGDVSAFGVPREHRQAMALNCFTQIFRSALGVNAPLQGSSRRGPSRLTGHSARWGLPTSESAPRRD